MHLKTSASRKQTDKEKAYQNQFGQNFHIQKKKKKRKGLLETKKEDSYMWAAKKGQH